MDSRADSLIHIADTIAGVIYRAHHPDRPDAAFLERVRHEIEDLWAFG